LYRLGQARNLLIGSTSCWLAIWWGSGTQEMEQLVSFGPNFRGGLAYLLALAVSAHNNQRQSDSQRYAPFVLLAVAQTLTQKALRAGCACAGR